MSQKKETTILVLSLLLTLGLVGGGFWLFKNQILPLLPPNPSAGNFDQSIANRISFGERILMPGVSRVNDEVVQAFANQNYSQAIASLESSLKQHPNDPIALIYLNNARIGSGRSYTIVASVPLRTNPNSSLEILRGIAQAQDAVNSSGGINGIRLKVGIANDDDNRQIAEKIAANLVKNSDVLGVIGHSASDTTLAAGKIYDSRQLVAISPTSTTVRLTNFSLYVFRTVPSDFIAARSLANYMVKNLQKKQAAIFFNSQSNYSLSLKNEFASYLSAEGGQVVSEFDLSLTNFSAARSLEEAISAGAEVVMLAPNADTLDKALQVVKVNGKRLPLLAGDTVHNITTLEVGGEQATGMVVAVPWHISVDPNSKFLQQSQQLWNAVVSWRTATAYDATVALIAALEKNPTRTGVRETLSSPNFSTPGASGAVQFLTTGDRRNSVKLVTIIRNRNSRSRTGFDFELIP